MVVSEVGLLRVVAVMVMEVGVTVDGRVVCTTVAIVVRVWGSPYLALLRSTGLPVILVGKAMGVVTPLSTPLLLLVGGHPPTLVREVTVVPTTAHVVMRVVAASLSSNLSANWRWCLIGWPGIRAGLLNRAQSPPMRRSVAPGPFGHIVILQSLLLPQWRG